MLEHTKCTGTGRRCACVSVCAGVCGLFGKTHEILVPVTETPPVAELHARARTKPVLVACARPGYINRQLITQEAIVSVRLEQFLDAVQIKPERQENFHIGLILQHGLVDWFRVFQLADADCIIALAVALRVQRIHNLWGFLWWWLSLLPICTIAFSTHGRNVCVDECWYGSCG